MTRTFHTVGQGAFYTERHKTHKGDDFIIVYDCGSMTFTKDALKKKINSAFNDKDEIDILFISHFHADHINGLEFLKNNFKIKKVVLPYLDDEAKTILKVSNYLSCENSYADLIDNPADFFGGETVIITVQVNEGEELVSTEEQSDNNDIDNLPTSIASGTKITSQTIVHKWFFIPFNYEHADRKKQFENNSGLKLEDFDAANKASVSKFKKAYEKIDGKGNVSEKLNKNSMILCSGFGKSSYLTRCFSNNCNYHSCHHFYHRFYPFQIESGCIYFGDIDLTQNNIVNNIRARLENFLKFIGIIQIPHHGSKENFNSDMLDNLPEIKCAVISFGTDNSHKHPSDRVISELLHKEIYPHLVTEKQDSVVIQYN
jgi:hypothetical protein